MLSEILIDIKNDEQRCEYEFLIALFTLLKLNGVPVLLQELNALSGYSMRFLYNYDLPYVYNLETEYILQNLKNNLGIEFYSFTVDSYKTVIELLQNYDSLVMYPGNFLLSKLSSGEIRIVRSYFENDFSETFQGTFNGTALSFKNSTLKERREIYKYSHFLEIVRNIIENFNLKITTVEGKEVSSGENAFEQFISDLRNPEKDFQGKSRLWLGEAFRSQWTSIYGFLSYFLGVYHFLDSGVQDSSLEVVKSIEDAILHLKDFNRVIGRESYIAPSKVLPMDVRRRATNSLSRAKLSLIRLTKLLEMIFMKGEN